MQKLRCYFTYLNTNLSAQFTQNFRLLSLNLTYYVTSLTKLENFQIFVICLRLKQPTL